MLVNCTYVQIIIRHAASRLSARVSFPKEALVEEVEEEVELLLLLLLFGIAEWVIVAVSSSFVWTLELLC